MFQSPDSSCRLRYLSYGFSVGTIFGVLSLLLISFPERVGWSVSSFTLWALLLLRLVY